MATPPRTGGTSATGGYATTGSHYPSSQVRGRRLLIPDRPWTLETASDFQLLQERLNRS